MCASGGGLQTACLRGRFIQQWGRTGRPLRGPRSPVVVLVLLVEEGVEVATMQAVAQTGAAEVGAGAGVQVLLEAETVEEVGVEGVEAWQAQAQAQQGEEGVGAWLGRQTRG